MKHPMLKGIGPGTVALVLFLTFLALVGFNNWGPGIPNPFDSGPPDYGYLERELEALHTVDCSIAKPLVEARLSALEETPRWLLDDYLDIRTSYRPECWEWDILALKQACDGRCAWSCMQNFEVDCDRIEDLDSSVACEVLREKTCWGRCKDTWCELMDQLQWP